MGAHIGDELAETLATYNAALTAGIAARGFGDVSLVDAEVLGQSCETPTLGAIARARDVTKQAIQGQMQSLVRRGYAVLVPDPQDARAKQVVLTEAGEGVVTAYAALSNDLHAAVQDKLGVERLKNMRNMLGQTRAALG